MDEKLIWAFFGTDEFSVEVLNTLKNKGLIPSLIITVPDKPKGRKMIMTPPLVKTWGEENGVTVVQPSSLKNLSFDKLDFSLVASYGKIIPQEILDLPTYGTLNIHPSLLPKYRGPSPLETAILNGDDQTGITIIKLDAEMDHGPILAQTKIDLDDKYNFEQLRDLTAASGAELLTKILPDYMSDKITPENQDHDQATYTKKFTKEDGLLDMQAPALNNYRKFLAFNPWPGVYLDYPGPTGKIRIVIKQAHLEADKLIYDLVTPEGRKEMTWASFINGLKK